MLLEPLACALVRVHSCLAVVLAALLVPFLSSSLTSTQKKRIRGAAHAQTGLPLKNIRQTRTRGSASVDGKEEEEEEEVPFCKGQGGKVGQMGKLKLDLGIVGHGQLLPYRFPLLPMNMYAVTRRLCMRTRKGLGATLQLSRSLHQGT